MSTNNKIDQYNLQDRVLSLRAAGNSTRVIAQILSDELDGKDTISQPSVSRWIKKETQRRKAVSDVVIEDYITTSLPGDLKILDELAETYLGLFRHNTGALNKVLKFLQSSVPSLDDYRALKAELESYLPAQKTKGNLNIPIEIDKPNLQTGMQAGDRLHSILQTKFRFIGVGDQDEEGSAKMTERERKELQEIAQQIAEKKRLAVNEQS